MEQIKNENDLDIKIIEINENNDIFDFIPIENHSYIQIETILSKEAFLENNKDEFDFGE